MQMVSRTVGRLVLFQGTHVKTTDGRVVSTVTLLYVDAHLVSLAASLLAPATRASTSAATTAGGAFSTGTSLSPTTYVTPYSPRPSSTNDVDTLTPLTTQQAGNHAARPVSFHIAAMTTVKFDPMPK